MRELLVKKENKIIERLEEPTVSTPPAEIAQIEEELVKEGMPREAIEKIRDVSPASPEEPLRMEDYELHCCSG